MDVLNTDWPGLAAEKGGCLNVIGNLPYYIVSQVLFSLADSHRSVDTAVLTMQLEVLQCVVIVLVLVLINNINIIILLFYLIIQVIFIIICRLRKESWQNRQLNNTEFQALYFNYTVLRQ